MVGSYLISLALCTLLKLPVFLSVGSVYWCVPVFVVFASATFGGIFCSHVQKLDAKPATLGRSFWREKSL